MRAFSIGLMATVCSAALAAAQTPSTSQQPQNQNASLGPRTAVPMQMAPQQAANQGAQPMQVHISTEAMPYGPVPVERPTFASNTGTTGEAAAQQPVPGATYTGETPSDVREATSVPRAMPPALPTLSPDHPLTAKQATEVSMVRHWRAHQFTRPVLGADGWMHLMYGDGEPSIVCAPLHICTIALQPGELVTAPPDISDPRWIVHPRFTFVGNRRVIDVLVKPTDAGLDGTIVIETNRRTYSINVSSRARDYMPLVRFDYPDDGNDSSQASQEWAVAAVGGIGARQDPCDATPIVAPASYRISGPTEPWKPVQVWAVATPVGEKTCVEFASDIGSKPLPALVALGNDAGWFAGPTPQIVNFRYVNGRFEIDEALDKFELISGVGSDQEKVTVKKVSQS